MVDWTITSLASPTLLASELQTAVNKLNNTRKVIQQSSDALFAECKILKRIIYRNRNQHHAQGAFQMLRGLYRYLTRLENLDLAYIMEKFRDTLPSTKRAYEDNDGRMKGKLLPALVLIKIFLETLLSAAQLTQHLSSYCKSTYARLAADISRGLFMSMNVATAAMVCRIATLLECIFGSTVHCYSGWRAAPSWVQSRTLVEHSLPECIHTFLGLPAPALSRAEASAALPDFVPMVVAAADDADEAEQPVLKNIVSNKAVVSKERAMAAPPVLANIVTGIKITNKKKRKNQAEEKEETPSLFSLPALNKKTKASKGDEIDDIFGDDD